MPTETCDIARQNTFDELEILPLTRKDSVLPAFNQTLCVPLARSSRSLSEVSAAAFCSEAAHIANNTKLIHTLIGTKNNSSMSVVSLFNTYLAGIVSFNSIGDSDDDHGRLVPRALWAAGKQPSLP